MHGHIKNEHTIVNNILCYNYIKILIFQIEEHNNEISPQPSASAVLVNGDPEPTTPSSDKSILDSTQPSTINIPYSGWVWWTFQPRIGVFTAAKACIS